MCRKNYRCSAWMAAAVHLVKNKQGGQESQAPSEERIQMRNRQKGFSLIELLIVVAIILIIAAIAIPNLLRSKMAANQASAVGSLRTLNTACIAGSSGPYQIPAGASHPGSVGSHRTTNSP